MPYFNNGQSLIRWGIALVYIWFGFQQLQHPLLFVAWIPKEAGFIPLEGWKLIMLNGGMEVTLGALLLIGVFTRISALVLGLHLAFITYSIGLSEIGVRDFGLTFATLGLAGMPEDKLSLENFIMRRVKRDAGSNRTEQQKEHSTQEFSIKSNQE